MSITSLIFFLFIFTTLILYYVVPKRLQWMVLLFASLTFYISCSTWGIVYVIVTATTVYISAQWLHSISVNQKVLLKENKDKLSKEEKAIIRNANKKKRKYILVTTLIFNFGILCVFKYFHFTLEQINVVINAFGGSLIEDRFNLIVPLGISFYTFQATGYLIDVYWGNCSAQKNYFKTLLFVSFFPQVTQGPISDYEQLSDELYSEHTFIYENYAQGFQRMIWGLFKKMVIADCLSPIVTDLFANYSEYTGLACLLGTFGYSVQIYADFSGYMDIMCGVCKMFGITLAENFERPYFSKSIAEYWRRWHITLGAWFKKYIYYPIGVSKWNHNLGKMAQKRFGKHVGQTIPASIALVVVWFTTGLWHGASWAYISWGVVNGLFIIISLWMEPVYTLIKKKLHIRENTFSWRAFQTIRTFILVTFIKVLPEVGTLSQGLGLWKRILTEHTIPTSFNALFPYVDDKLTFSVIILGVILLFVSSLLQRKNSLLELFNKCPLILRIVCLTMLLLLIFIFGVASNEVGGFMYVQF